MSYILDALKKNQIEEHARGVSLEPPRRSAPRWLAMGLAAVILINLGLVGWIVWNQKTDTNEVAANGVMPTPGVENTPTNIATATPPAEAVTSTAPPTTQPVSAPVKASEIMGQPVPQTVTQRQPRVRPAPRSQLRDLPAGEQILYNEFTYSTHIYTDDPSLCAIVVNGQRLTAGDTFQGLKVVAITEAGVVFEENRRGQRREVEVSVIEQWDNE